MPGHDFISPEVPTPHIGAKIHFYLIYHKIIKIKNINLFLNKLNFKV